MSIHDHTDWPNVPASPAPHWKHAATRCAVVGCDRTRRKGWSTCTLTAHYSLGRSLYGAGRIEPVPAPCEAQR